MSKTTPPDEGRDYPCEDCGVMRTKDEGGTVFTVCDDCWAKHYGEKKCECCKSYFHPEFMKSEPSGYYCEECWEAWLG